jgi:hypothetical protein
VIPTSALGQGDQVLRFYLVALILARGLAVVAAKARRGDSYVGSSAPRLRPQDHTRGKSLAVVLGTQF